MARPRTQTEDAGQPEIMEGTIQTEPTNEPVPASQPEPEPTPEPAEEKPAKPKSKTAEAGEEPDEYAKSILASYPGYETLYIDHHGGAFTPDTPAAIRGNSVLYRNPHYKP